jgi:hypothetical protein
LEQLLIQNENREISSSVWLSRQSNLAYLPLLEQSSGCRLQGCIFPDEGVAFVDTARQHSSLTKLSLWERLPFDFINFVWCLHHVNLEYLRLTCITLDGESCRAVATAEINYLHLAYCEFEDEEAVQVLVDNIRVERGPKGLCLKGEPFKSHERLGDLMNALRGNTSLERLDLGSFFVRTGSFQALVTALPENRGLTHLGLTFCTVDDRCWDKINLYRKRFRAIQAIGLDKTRAAITARALARIALADVRSESSLIFMVLSQNCDVFCSHLDEVLSRDNHISVPSRKRSRLPTEDATSPL